MGDIQRLLLFCLKSIENQRTAYAVLHLFNGKKSSQTIQDAHLFHLKKCFHIFPDISREDFNELLKQLVLDHHIIHLGEGNYQLTKKGDMQLQRSNFDMLLNYVDGWSFGRMDTLFWERLSLMVQVVSNLVVHNGRYIPIQNNKQHLDWLKTFIQRNGKDRYQVARQLYHELRHILSRKDIDPLVLVLRLTGSDRFGLTAQQTAEQLKMSQYTYQLQFKNIIHMILSDIKSNGSSYPLLSQLMASEVNDEWSQLTQSTKKTAIYLKQGYIIEDIIKIRNLKKGTIEDHIVELAIVDPTFHIDDYVPPNVQKEILQVQATGSKQLKYIRQLIPHASYFQIRLVLAKQKSVVSV